ncbi:16S rRNA (cytidine(1402)-2'-O)-methyltransferase [Candidatus Curtissbacteria bacterium RIFCSPHIGHO2_12_41_11]|uniref:Ribosomal RNA small subunit methyltransferase I n=2 Tax=Candidatus Curtissiibacteriota TaxID=1752717 RepID=A0A1F5H8A6_9BACT|nr:MAG: 16S rRNA (cytidine(1402)-2'-O)-methyltransferase [Candidatus Curtissbacteria bacterium RIFCSPHIGHO2_02_FULL_42_15]OGE00393.1 MAG: 16S rRNA (cytidine(1402)-2'-O)-methyltransferase [Candidatus Curtissbacteria bacterium RIFCSPHIGHO2_12_41_11]
MQGILYVISTPIGNLGDITKRAVDTLKNLDILLVEDTRVSGKLLKNFDIGVKMISFNEYTEKSKTDSIINLLKDGKKVGIISDAGTPLISDPGFLLVRAAAKSGVKVVAIPGPTALIYALTVSGLPTDKFIFFGYLPKKEGKRTNILKNLKKTSNYITATIIFYESPYRLLVTLKSINEVFGDIDIVICRELTKLHEEIRREKVTEAIKHFSEIAPKGEFTLLFHSK